MYIITMEEKEYAYQDPKKFTDAFFTCNTEVADKYINLDEYIIEVKAVADLIKRPTPLSLLEPFFTSEKTETGWISLGN